MVILNTITNLIIVILLILELKLGRIHHTQILLQIYRIAILPVEFVRILVQNLTHENLIPLALILLVLLLLELYFVFLDAELLVRLHLELTAHAVFSQRLIRNTINFVFLARWHECLVLCLQRLHEVLTLRNAEAHVDVVAGATLIYEAQD